MSNPDGPACVDPESLAAYVDHGLSLAERAHVEAHLASCPQCTALLAEVVRTVADVPALQSLAARGVAEPAPRNLRRAVLGALAAAAAVFAVVAAPPFAVRWIDREAGLVDLAGGLGEQRTVLGRLTGGLPHAPLRTPSAGGQDGLADGNGRVELTAGRIRESFGDIHTASGLHAAGVADLLSGRLDAAAYALAAASREQPANARYLNDVAAVYLERARRGLRPDDLPRAFAAAERARRLDPSLREAWFNRALALQTLSLTDHAKAAWTEYLARDSASPWAAEARARLADVTRPAAAAAWSVIEARLQQQIDPAAADEAVRTNPTEARNLIETQLLVAWADAVLAGSSGTPELDRARVMAESMLRVSGDALYRDAVAALESAAPNTERRNRLARAHAAYASAAAVFAEDRFTAAATELEGAHALFAGHSPFALRVQLDLAAIAYVNGRAADALSDLTAAAATAQARGYAYANGRANWLLGLVHFGQGRLADTEIHYQQALAAFDAMHDVEQAASAHDLLAGLAYYLGDSKTEWQHRLAAFQGLAISHSPRFRYRTQASAAAAMRLSQPETALLVQEAALDTAQEWGRAPAIAESLAQRAAILFELGRRADAAANVRRAREALSTVPDPQFRDRIEVVLLATESDLYRDVDPSASADAARTAIEHIRNRRDRLRLAQLNLKLAKARLAQGRIDEAEVALEEGIREFEIERRSVSDEGRISALEESWQLFDTAVLLAVRKGDLARAFELSERSRARTVAEARQNPTPTLSDVERRLDADRAVVAINQFDDEAVIWVIRRAGTTAVTRPLSRQDAVKLVERQQTERLLGARTPAASTALYNELIRPVARSLAGASHLIIVADRPYANAAFAAFFDSSRGAFLVERVSMVMSPTVSAAVTRTAEAVTDRSALVLSGPHSDDREPSLASLYASASVLQGEAATRARFLAAAPGHAVVHLNARMVDNTAHPLLSRIMLADEPGRPHSGALLATEIGRANWSRTRLVVIEDTAAMRALDDQPSAGVARAFVTAGVPEVLRTLPGADEAAVREVIMRFHREAAGGVPGVDALTRIQREVLQSNGHRLAAWSALVIYGSDR